MYVVCDTVVNQFSINNFSAGSGTISGTLNIASTATSTSTTTGALIVGGGVGIAGNLYVGGNLFVTGNTTLSYDEIIYRIPKIPINVIRYSLAKFLIKKSGWRERYIDSRRA
jgi:hypothetical protein